MGLHHYGGWGWGGRRPSPRPRPQLKAFMLEHGCISDALFEALQLKDEMIGVATMDAALARFKDDLCEARWRFSILTAPGTRLRWIAADEEGEAAALHKAEAAEAKAAGKEKWAGKERKKDEADAARYGGRWDAARELSVQLFDKAVKKKKNKRGSKKAKTAASQDKEEPAPGPAGRRRGSPTKSRLCGAVRSRTSSGLPARDVPTPGGAPSAATASSATRGPARRRWPRTQCGATQAHAGRGGGSLTCGTRGQEATHTQPHTPLHLFPLPQRVARS